VSPPCDVGLLINSCLYVCVCVCVCVSRCRERFVVHTHIDVPERGSSLRTQRETLSSQFLVGITSTSSRR